MNTPRNQIPLKRTHLVLAFALLAGGALVPVLSNSGGSYQVVHGWPALPDGFFLGEAGGVDVDSHGCVFVFHRGKKPILRLDGESGSVKDSWGGDMFSSGAHGLSVDHDDNVWVTDIQLHQVVKFSHDGKLLASFGEKETPGLDGKHFDKPTDVEVAPNGDFYVTDGYGNSRVAKFSADGKFIRDWGKKGEGKGEFQTPHGISLGRDGKVYICDRENTRIQVFDEDGKLLHVWDRDELGRPWGIDVGPDNYLYVTDGGDFETEPPGVNRVMRLDLDGNLLESWGSFGKYDGQFYWAHDVAADASGNVFVVDVKLGMRVQKFVRR